MFKIGLNFKLHFTVIVSIFWLDFGLNMKRIGEFKKSNKMLKKPKIIPKNILKAHENSSSLKLDTLFLLNI